MQKNLKQPASRASKKVQYRKPQSHLVPATMTMNLLEDWCRGMDRDIHRSLLVTGVPVDCGQQEIEETLNGVLSPLGSYLVLNKFFVRQQNAKAVLVEVGEGVNLSTVPREFPGRGGVWRVVCREPTQNAEFLKNLSEFLECEGRTWEDVVRLLQLNQPPLPRNQSQRPENWADALGMLLGAVVQMVFYSAAEVHSQEEAQAQQAAEAQALAASANSAAVKVKKEPGRSEEEGSARKENLHSLDNLEAEGDPPKPLVHKAGTSIWPGRKKQKNTPKQEAVPWKKPKDDRSSSSASLGDPKADEAESVEISECIRSCRKPCMKQEESALKKPVAKSAWKAPSHPAQDARSEAESPGVACESAQDGAQEGPPKKKAMGWPSAKSPASLRKKKKVSLGPVSYVLVDSEETKKKPAITKKSHGSRRGGSVHEAWRSPPPPESTASTSQGHTAKPEGSSQGSKASKKH
ncbi:paraneoplastic antigen-like protein 8A [Talpa occidentalis]|uniref:paraneoplastic antigen-like protein 8A n=1 Tax=Talpa occidentalis TaxID=50954 RepID=UPI00189012FC|nr:paraneoplastic antigen-like protein 8A [Talpa occidentalis]